MAKVAALSVEYPMSPYSVAHFGDDKIQNIINKGIQNYLQSVFSTKAPESIFGDSFVWSKFAGDAIGFDLKYNKKNRVSAPEKYKKNFSNLKLSQYYENSGILVSRPFSNFSIKGLAATIKYLGGTHVVNGSHDHDDVGSYVISKNGVLLAGDVGVQSYDGQSFNVSVRYTDKGRASSYGHPVPYINNEVQKRSWLVDTKPYVLSHSSTDSGDYIVYDMKPAYNSSDIKALKRTYEYLRHKDSQSVRIKDEVEFYKLGNFETALTSIGKWVKYSNSEGFFEFKTDWRFDEDFRYRTEKVFVKIESDNSFSLDEETLSNVDLNYRRIGVRLNNKVMKAKISVTYT
jgi:hypothetical protein